MSGLRLRDRWRAVVRAYYRSKAEFLEKHSPLDPGPVQKAEKRAPIPYPDEFPGLTKEDVDELRERCGCEKCTHQGGRIICARVAEAVNLLKKGRSEAWRQFGRDSVPSPEVQPNRTEWRQDADGAWYLFDFKTGEPVPAFEDAEGKRPKIFKFPPIERSSDFSCSNESGHEWKCYSVNPKVWEQCIHCRKMRKRNPTND